MTPSEHSAPHPVPGAGAVLREQARAVGLALRREIAAALALMAAVAAITGFFVLRGSRGGEFALADVALVPALLAFFAPAAVWRGEPPSRRAYFWTLPVERPRHTLVKTLAGWGWLMALVAAFLLWAAASAAMTGGDFRVGGEWAQVLTHRHLPPARRITPLALQAWMWLVPFLGATVTYLLGSALVLASEHPWRWLSGGLLAAFLVYRLPAQAPRNAMDAVLMGRAGLATLLTGIPSSGAWLTAVAVWGAGALVLVAAAARRHPGRAR